MLNLDFPYIATGYWWPPYLYTVTVVQITAVHRTRERGLVRTSTGSRHIRILPYIRIRAHYPTTMSLILVKNCSKVSNRYAYVLSDSKNLNLLKISPTLIQPVQNGRLVGPPICLVVRWGDRRTGFKLYMRSVRFTVASRRCHTIVWFVEVMRSSELAQIARLSKRQPLFTTELHTCVAKGRKSWICARKFVLHTYISSIDCQSPDFICRGIGSLRKFIRTSKYYEGIGVLYHFDRKFSNA
jgi:hypothetical protein